MQRYRIGWGALSSAAIMVLLASCGDDGGGDVQPTPVVAAVTLTAPQNSIQVGQTVLLTATARDANGTALTGHTFEWSTADAAVASVSPTGVVTGVAEGQAQISATTEGKTGSIAIAVTAAPPQGLPELGLEPVATGFDFPTGLVSPPGDSRIFVVEKAGTIRLIKAGAVVAQPFLDLSARVESQGGEQGLLGLAFAPDYTTSGRFYVHYNAPGGENRVSLFQVSADPDRGDPATESVVLSVPQPGVAHNGGQILFGPDGFLYIGLGDGADNDGGRGQSVSDLFASILRIDVSAGAQYSVPADNPFVGTAGARPEVWSYGLRNPWRFSFDRTTGDLYIGDVGESQWEEVNFSSTADGAGRGVNYGWALMEGRHCTRSSCDETGLALPVLEYEHPSGCSVIGGYVYRGTAIPSLQGNYFYADYCRGWVRSFRMEGGVLVGDMEWPTLQTGGRVTSFGEDAVGEIYLATEQGNVYKIVQR